MRVFVLAGALTATLFSSAATAAEDTPPAEIYSPNHRFSVRILQSALPGSDPDNGFFTIGIRHDRRYLAKYPTIGFLLDAFWSPDEKYVAVDNRRSNSGDYLWVFRLKEGRAVRMPADAVPRQPDQAYEKYAKDLVQRVTQKFPELTYGSFRKLFTFAKGWTSSGDLLVKTNFAFENLPDDQVAILLQTFRVAGDKLLLVDEQVDKAPWPPKT
jgi:hypothetical protein